MKKTDPGKNGETNNVNEINKLKKQVEELTNNWKRALADYQNLERRTQQEKEKFATYIKAELIKKLLPVLDNLEKAIVHTNDNGLTLVVKTMVNTLKNEGLQEIAAEGKKFDPLYMEAIDITEGKDDDQVLKVFEKGYVLSDTVLRPARVQVSKKAENNKN